METNGDGGKSSDSTQDDKQIKEGDTGIVKVVKPIVEIDGQKVERITWNVTIKDPQKVESPKKLKPTDN